MQGIKETEEKLSNLFKARFPIIYVESWEENRVTDTIQRIAENVELIKTIRTVYMWSSTSGLINLNSMTTVDNSFNAIDAIENFSGTEENAILILKDVHNDLSTRTISLSENRDIKRVLRDTANSIRGSEFVKNIVLIAPVLELPVELQKDVTVFDFALPNVSEIKELLDSMIEANLGKNCKLTEEEKSIFAKTAQGLTLQEAENAFARAMVERKQLTLDELDIIMDEKCQVIKKTGILEFIKSDLKIDDVGGLENLKHWLIKRNNSWLDKAHDKYNLPAPKGVLITGVPGCGKSLTAKAMSSLWKLPLLRLDAGKIFDKWVGGSEENIRIAIKTAEAVAPSILWIDEIEKGFDQNEGSIGKRIFGTFLTWMQEKTKPVFVVATANNISLLPPEMLRKGRFDEIFFVDLPTLIEREIIFKLHLDKMLKGSISEDFEITDKLIKKLVDMTEGFVGAEIEQVIISAVFDAYSEDRILQEDDLYRAVKNTVPLSVTQQEQIESIREWANVRAVAATSHEDNEINTNKKGDTKVVKLRGGRNVDF